MKAWPADRAAALGARLAERARRSAEAHRDYRTTRRDDLRWTDLGPGATEALLHAGEYARATLVRLAPGARLPWPMGTSAQEILLVEGRLVAMPADQAPLVMEPRAFALRAAEDVGELVVDAGEAALLYVRQMLAPPTSLPGPEGRWWATPRRPLQVVHAAGRRWRPTFAGVELLPMWGTVEMTSMLVRFAPGASVPDHHHAAHEDCLMLDGEMFLGDILLRTGDYQLAPAGGGHFGETSDVGCTFFFHGAIDPVLIALGSD
jgi:quercetin dioxygenase-like cupin family protein